MRRYDVVTLFPELVNAVAASGIPAQAKAAGLYAMQCWNPRIAATKGATVITIPGPPP